MKRCKICNAELLKYQKIYCSNFCKFNDTEFNKKRISSIKNDFSKIIECNFCGWRSKDCLNKSGILTNHVKKHNNMAIDKCFSIKNTEIKPVLSCILCDWKTIDITNKSGCFTNHIKNIHKMCIDTFIKTHHTEYDSNLFKTTKTKILNQNIINTSEKNRIQCKVCNKYYKKLSCTHLKNHNLTPREYKIKYNVFSTCSERTTNIQKTKSLSSQYAGVRDRIHEYNCTAMFSDDEYAGVINNKKYQFKCNSCNNIFSSTLDDGKGPVCKFCFPSLKFSPNKKLETEIYEFLNSLFPEKVLVNDRTILSPLELDFYIPEQHIAIEINGLYWHGEYYKDKNYHLNKTNLCDQKNIRLIHIFEDEWYNKKEIVKSKLIHILNKNNKEKIYARKCNVMEIDSKMSNSFLEKNHIQGKDNSSYKYGLFYENELVAVMTFSKPRISLGGNVDSNSEYELCRYASSISKLIIGGSGKLLSHFIKQKFPRKIITYADRRWSVNNNNLYTQLNFKYKESTRPSYFWCIGKKRYHRYNFTKYKLINCGKDPQKTEIELMKEDGYYRIWDCGHLKYELSLI